MGMTRHTGLFPKATEEVERKKISAAIDGEVARRIDPDKTANAVILLEKQRWVYE